MKEITKYSVCFNIIVQLCLLYSCFCLYFGLGSMITEIFFFFFTKPLECYKYFQAKNMFSFLFKNHGYSAVFTGVFNSVWIQFYLLSLCTKLTDLFLIGIFFERQFEIWIIDALRWKGIIRKRACYKHDILMKVVNISALVTFFFQQTIIDAL